MRATTAGALSDAERSYLARARELALEGRGRVSPNPLVGAIVVDEEGLAGEGWHEGPGTAHAEVMALRAAGERAVGATVICTLEPCSHHGRTPPCTDALIAAGVRRVVIGTADPLERARAGGAEVLRAAGLDVAVASGWDGDACRELNSAFITHAVTGRPEVTLKMATSLDGKVATADGETRWITGEAARELVHRMRADADAVAVGIGTVLADDPTLTARDVAGPVRQPLRVVFDREARTPTDGRLAHSLDEGPVLVLTGADAAADRVDGLRSVGFEVVSVGGAGAEQLREALAVLGQRDVQSLFLEGGPTLAEAFVAAGAVDRVEWFVAPKLIGGVDAPGALAGAGLGRLAEVPTLHATSVSRAGDDVLVSGRLTPVGGG